MNLEFTFSVSSDIKWRVTCDLTENTPFIRNVFWGNTEVKDISPSILELIEEQAMKQQKALFVGDELRHVFSLEGIRRDCPRPETARRSAAVRVRQTAARTPACKARADLDGENDVIR